jgi:hypothetical protein
METFRTARLAMTAALFLLLLGGIVRPARAEGARQLTATTSAVLAGVAQAAGDPRSGLALGKPKFAPFWSALAAMRSRVSRIEESLDRRDGEFFGLVDQGSTDLGELRVAWARTGARNEKVAEGLRIASASYRRLRSTYGREGGRQRQGGPLSDAERRQLLRLQRVERRLAENLRLLRDQARRRHDAATAAELERFRAEAERIAWAPPDLGSYLNALIAASEMRGEWSADAPYVRRVVPPQAWAAADETVQDLAVDSDIGRVFTVDLGETPETPETTEATEATDTPDAAGAETGSAAEAVPVVEEVVVGPEDERDARDDRDGEDMGTEDAEAGPEATVPAVPVGAQQAAPAPAQTAPPAKPADPPAAPPIPPPIG